MNIYGAARYDCPDSVNSYIVSDLYGSAIPASGSNVIVESINTVAYEVTAKVNLVNNIPAYDPNSFECQNYLYQLLSAPNRRDQFSGQHHWSNQL